MSAAIGAAFTPFLVHALHVPRQMLAPVEIFVANAAVERGRFVLSLMPCEVRRVSAGVLADITLENFLTSVCSLMGDY